MYLFDVVTMVYQGLAYEIQRQHKNMKATAKFNHLNQLRQIRHLIGNCCAFTSHHQIH